MTLAIYLFSVLIKSSSASYFYDGSEANTSGSEEESERPDSEFPPKAADGGSDFTKVFARSRNYLGFSSDFDLGMSSSSSICT